MLIGLIALTVIAAIALAERSARSITVAVWIVGSAYAIVELGVAEVRLTSDIRGVTIDFDGTAQQTLNSDDASPLSSAIGRGVDRLRVKKKSDEGLTARRDAPPAPPD